MLSYAGYHRHRHYAGDAAAVVAAEEKLEKQSKLKAVAAAAKEQLTAAAVNKGVAVLAAGGMGMYQGQKGKLPVYGGLSVDFIIGVGASALGLLGHNMPYFKNQKLALEAIDGLGTGALSFWAANYGNAAGLAKAQKEALAKAAAAPAAPAATAKGFDGFDPRSFAPHFDSSPAVEDSSSSSVPYGYR